MENRFEHFTLDIFNISKYWNKIASEEMKEYGLRGAHAADVSRAIADFQKKGILEPYDGPRYRFTPKLTPRGHALAAQIRARATVALDLAGQGITDEMRENMYHCLDLIATNMRLICEDGLMEQTDR